MLLQDITNHNHVHLFSVWNTSALCNILLCSGIEVVSDRMIVLAAVQFARSERHLHQNGWSNAANYMLNDVYTKFTGCIRARRITHLSTRQYVGIHW